MGKLDNVHGLLDGMVAMSDGNPGAATVLSRIYNEFGQHVLAATMINLDSKGIYGHRIWFAYKYCFLYNIKDMLEWLTK